MNIKVGDLFQRKYSDKIYEVKEINEIERNGFKTLSYCLIEIEPVLQQTTYYTSIETIINQFIKIN